MKHIRTFQLLLMFLMSAELEITNFIGSRRTVGFT